MSEEDRRYWDDWYGTHEPRSPDLPVTFAQYADQFPESGHALELACGSGEASLALAERGLDVLGVDVSPAAIDRARALADELGLECSFAVVDLDDGLPPGPPAGVILCHMFREPRLDPAIIERLAPGGILALACLSEVGVGPGRFRARAGELSSAFASLDAIATSEGDGRAWILARKRESVQP